MDMEGGLGEGVPSSHICVKVWDNLCESRGGSSVNGAPREFPESTQCTPYRPREKIEGPPRNFLKANPRPHPRPDKRPKTRGAAGPEGFWPLVWPRIWPRVCLKKIPKGAFNILPREYIEYSRDLPRAPITMIPPRLSHSYSFFLPNALLYYVKREKK